MQSDRSGTSSPSSDRCVHYLLTSNLATELSSSPSYGTFKKRAKCNILSIMILEKMNFEEVINPHYACPIVGVILCALLVFAFGFKTPAQPPSFDFEEHRRVTGKKKQKSKEKLKIVQNGSTPPPKGITSVKEQPEFEPISPVAERPMAKQETKSKVKKLPAVQQQQAAQPEVKQVTAPEDTTGGKWKQQLSKKDRKNRKNVDPPELEKKSETLSKGNTSPAKEKVKTPKESSAPAEEEVVKEDDPPSETKTKPEAPAKEQREPKKKTPKTEPKTSPAEPEKISEQTKGKAKKEKKIEEVKPKVVEKAAEIPKPVEVKPAPVPTPIQDTEKSTTSDKPSAENNENDGSTNVAFDELGDMWQDSKPQKKKKKARRE